MNWLIGIFVMVIAAKLWRMGGDGQAWARAFCVPAVIVLGKVIMLVIAGAGWNTLYALIYGPALWGMMSLFSYGTSAPPHKVVVWLFGGKGSDGNYRPVEVVTRAICGFFWALAGLVFAFVTGGWLMFGCYVLFLTVMNGLIGGLVKDVEISERAVGACVAAAVFI